MTSVIALIGAITSLVIAITGLLHSLGVSAQLGDHQRGGHQAPDQPPAR